MTISDEEEYNLLKNWFKQTFFEAWKILPKILDNPARAHTEMNRLERHSVYHLHRAAKLGIRGEA